MTYTLQSISTLFGIPLLESGERTIRYIETDSRKVLFPEQTLFFAITGIRRTGAQFIAPLYEKGVRGFVVDQAIDTAEFPAAVFFHVSDTVKALQQFAAYHRKQFNIPVIAITGSNGKTMVKEWLYQLLQNDYNIVRSPRSYNSQIGVPLSILQIDKQHTLGIFEAGISTKHEMQNLVPIINPSIGIFTNIGAAHDEGFINREEKKQEKFKLFEKISLLINVPEDIQIGAVEKHESGAQVLFGYKEIFYQLLVPFEDEVSITNIVTCVALLLELKYSWYTIQERVLQLSPLEMRMQLRKAVNQSFVLNDSYSNDLVSLRLALNFLKEQAGTQKTTVILSDIFQSGMDDKNLYDTVINLLVSNGINKLFAIGKQWSLYLSAIDAPTKIHVAHFETALQFLSQVYHKQFNNEYILVKGARVFELEQIAHWLEKQVHQTVMEINLSAMVRNLNKYQQILNPGTKMMVMVKAFGYGAGDAEIARKLAQQGVDYLAVAYADEGVALRQAGIKLPIMVMSADEGSFHTLVNNQLEPEIFSMEMAIAFKDYLGNLGIAHYPVHIKLNTGMNRLGFDAHEVHDLAQFLIAAPFVVKSVFSHLVASEAAIHDDFTKYQLSVFEAGYQKIMATIGYDCLQHIANTAAIKRFPATQYNMVRLGIGLYGADSGAAQLHTEPVALLKTTVAQVRTIKAGETVGYGRAGVVTRNSRIATVRIGYADGYSRKLGNGVGRMKLVSGYATVIGNVCMDMTMLDVTDLPDVVAGDIVEVMGANITAQELATRSGTIAYEILTGIHARVKRVYVEE
jgi:Alr-MurF fusion protein